MLYASISIAPDKIHPASVVPTLIVTCEEYNGTRALSNVVIEENTKKIRVRNDESDLKLHSGFEKKTRFRL